MLRRLANLNRQDVLQEFHQIGVHSPNLALIDVVHRGYSIKLSGYRAAQLKKIERVARKAGGEFIRTPESDTRPPAAILAFASHNPSEISELLSGAVPAGLAGFREELQHLIDNCEKHAWEYRIANRTLKIDHPLIMGILNVTPDSFSDGGRFATPEEQIEHVFRMLEAGAELIDIGGESTRPGAAPVALEEEWQRISPVLRSISRIGQCLISIDTYKSEIARRALQEGAHLINDISAMSFDPEMVKVAKQFDAPVVLMHIKGMPRSMQQHPFYEHLMEDIYSFLWERCHFAVTQGVDQLIVDPGIGFGKRLEDNYELLRRLAEFKGLGYPVLLGASRKSFIGNLLDAPPEARLTGTIAANLYGLTQGANILRVHDVEEIKQAVEIYEAIQSYKAE